MGVNMTDILKSDEFSELLHEYGDTPEVQEFLEEFLTPEMMSRPIGSTEVKAYWERFDLQLITLDKNDAVKRGVYKTQ
jgi:hypothetical protein